MNNQPYFTPVIRKKTNQYGLTHNMEHKDAKLVRCTTKGTVLFLDPVNANLRGVPPEELEPARWTDFNLQMAKRILETEPLLAALVCAVGRITSMDSNVKAGVLLGYLDEYLIDKELLLACTKSHTLQIEKILEKLEE